MLSFCHRHLVVLALCAVMAFCISGCGSGPGAFPGNTSVSSGGGGSGSGPGGGSPPPPPPDTTEYIYVGAEPYLLVYQVETKTGTPTLIQSFSGAVPFLSAGSYMAATNPAKYLYVAGSDGNGIYAYSIASNGALTLVKGSPFIPSPSQPNSVIYSMALTLDGTTLYIGQSSLYQINPDRTTDLITGLKVDPSTGQLTPLPINVSLGQANVQGSATQQNQLIIDPSGSFVYADLNTTGITNSNGNPYAGIAAFSIDPKTKNLTPLANSPFTLPSNSAPSGLTMDSTGHFVYVALGNSGGIAGFSRDSATGNLSPIEGSPFLTATAFPNYILMHPTGKFLFGPYSDASGNCYVATYSIDSTTGALSQIAESTGACSTGQPLTIDPTGYYLYGAAYSGNLIFSQINPTNGTLSPSTVVPYSGLQLNWGPTSLAIVPAH